MLALPLALVLGVGAAPPADNVRFHFDCPAGLKSDLELRRSRAVDGQGASEESLHARLATETRGDEIRVSFRDWTGPEALDPVSGAGRRVTTVVTRDGAFERIEGIESALQALQTRLAPLKDARPDFVARLERMAPAMFAKDASETWGLLVQAWRGRTFEVGQEYLHDSEAPVAVLSGEKVRIHASFRVARLLPCPVGGACVEARMRSEPDPHDIARVVRRLVGELGIPVAEAGQFLREMPAIVDVVLVTDPATLVPYRLELTRTTRVTPAGGARNGAKPLEGKDVTVYTFAYAPPAAP